MFLKNRNIIFKMKISKVTDYAALNYMALNAGLKVESKMTIGNNEGLAEITLNAFMKTCNRL